MQISRKSIAAASPHRRAALLRMAASVLAATGVHGIAAANDYPSRPVRLVVPTAVGGTVDLLARVVAERLEPALRMPVTVENRAGAGGVIGCEAVARAAPDGYTLLFAPSSTHTMAPHLHARPPFDPFRDFAPIVNLASTTTCLVVGSALPARTLRELVAHAQAHPGRLNYASTGVGSAPHLNTEVLKAALQIDLVHVPYRGSVQAYAALRAGDVHVMLGNVGTAVPFVRTGEATALVVFGDRRSQLLPEVPTAAELGLDGLNMTEWTALFGPAGTAPEAINRLNAEVNQVLAQPAVLAWLQARGLERIGGTPAALAQTMRKDYDRWALRVRQVGVRVE